MAKLFTKEEQECLKANPYTRSISDRQIKFTLEFKKYLLSEISKPNVTHKMAFRKAGYDPDMLGKQRIESIVYSLRRQAASPQGLHETGASKARLAEQDLSRKRTETAIKELQRELVKTQQELAFLKKILQLPPKDDETP